MTGAIEMDNTVHLKALTINRVTGVAGFLSMRHLSNLEIRHGFPHLSRQLVASAGRAIAKRRRKQCGSETTADQSQSQSESVRPLKIMNLHRNGKLAGLPDRPDADGRWKIDPVSGALRVAATRAPIKATVDEASQLPRSAPVLGR